MQIGKVMPWDSCFQKDVQGANIVPPWKVIHQVLGVFDDHGPQFG